jgi:hypothetical protein
MSDAWRAHPAVRRLARVATALGDFCHEVVFVGGAIAPLLQTDPPFGAPRPTRDVDAVVASRGYWELKTLHERLTSLGFRQDPSEAQHMHRWLTPDGDLLDLVPAGAHAGGSGQLWDQLALDTSVESELDEGVAVRHASGPAFLALKWAAHLDRGAADPFASHDLEDFLALLAARPAVIREVADSPAEIAGFLASAADALIGMMEIEDLLAGHLNNADDPAATSLDVRRSLVDLAAGHP